MNRLSHDSSEDVLTAHYLGGRSFGPWLTLGTMFASLFSGFTIIGIPNGAVSIIVSFHMTLCGTQLAHPNILLYSMPMSLQYNYGWKELEWVATISLLTFVFSGVAPR